MGQCVTNIHNPDTTLTFYLKDRFIVFSCPAYNYFLIWHWLTIFGTCIYHHERMCHVHSWSRFDLDLWPQCHIYWDFDMFSSPAHNYFFLFDIGLPYLAHASITIKGCVTYIHEPDSTWPLTSISHYCFLTCYRVRPITIFLILHWLTIFGTYVYHYERMFHVNSWARFDLDLWPQCHTYRVYDMTLFGPQRICPLI